MEFEGSLLQALEREAAADASAAEGRGVKSWLDRRVILPGTVTGRWWLEMWDSFMGALVLAAAYTEPYAMALYTVAKRPACFVVLHDFYHVACTADMLLQPFISFPLPPHTVHKDLWEKRFAVLARHYCSVPWRDGGRLGWFWLDLLSLAPGWLGICLEGGRSANPLLLLQMFRSMQAVRRVRLQKLMELCHAQTGFPQNFVQVLKFVAITTLACHWIACIWVLSEGKLVRRFLSYGPHQQSWLSSLIEAKGDSCRPEAAQNPQCVYIIALYWSAMTLTSIGYGDISPQTKAEYIIAIACMLILCYVWAYIVGSICSILSRLDLANSEFRNGADELSTLMARRALPARMQVRLRSFVHETRKFARQKLQRQLLEECLSDSLQREVAAHSAEAHGALREVFWLQDVQEEAVLDVVRALRPEAYPSEEHIQMREIMIIMQKGIAGVKGRVLSRGDVWGQADILIQSPQLLDSMNPKTLSFVELLILAKESLINICRDYPSMDQRLRRAQIRTAVHRAFCREARQTARIRQLLLGGTLHKSMIAGMELNTGHLGSFAYVAQDSLPLSGDGKKVDFSDLLQLLKQVSARQDALEYRFEQLRKGVALLPPTRDSVLPGPIGSLFTAAWTMSSSSVWSVASENTDVPAT